MQRLRRPEVATRYRHYLTCGDRGGGVHAATGDAAGVALARVGVIRDEMCQPRQLEEVYVRLVQRLGRADAYTTPPGTSRTASAVGPSLILQACCLR
jgi:hypothetical protein